MFKNNQFKPQAVHHHNLVVIFYNVFYKYLLTYLASLGGWGHSINFRPTIALINLLIYFCKQGLWFYITIDVTEKGIYRLDFTLLVFLLLGYNSRAVWKPKNLQVHF